MSIVIVAIICGCAALLVLALTDYPGRVLSRDPDWTLLKPLERFQMEAALRTAMIQALGGLILVVGSTVGVSQYILSRAQRDDARAVQRALAFAKAIEDLDADSESRRLAGAILLKNGVAAGTYDRQEVVAILAQYIRDHAGAESSGSSLDVAIQMLGTGETGGDKINLRGLDLRKRNFLGTDLTKFDLENSDLRGARLPPEL